MNGRQQIVADEPPVPFSWRMPWWCIILRSILYIPFFVIAWSAFFMALHWAPEGPVWQRVVAFVICIAFSIPAILLYWSPVAINYDGRSVSLVIALGLKVVRMPAEGVLEIGEPPSRMNLLKTQGKSYFLISVPKDVQEQLAAIVLVDQDTPFVSSGERI